MDQKEDKGGVPANPAKIAYIILHNVLYAIACAIMIVLLAMLTASLIFSELIFSTHTKHSATNLSGSK